MPKPKKTDCDIRFVLTDGVEIREAVEEGDDPVAEGLGVIYDREVEIFPGFFERIERDAFDDTLGSDSEIKSFFNHDPSAVLSTTRSRPRLELSDRENGLYYRSPIPPTSYGSDLAENLRRGNVRGSSFAFRVPVDGDEWSYDADGNMHRVVRKAELLELGPVTNPAYIATSANLRSAEDLCREVRERRDADKESERVEQIAEREKEINLARCRVDLIG